MEPPELQNIKQNWALVTHAWSYTSFV
jgi:hypothetical protein